MQRKESIPREALTQVLGAVYQGSPVVMEGYGVPGCELMQFEDQPALEQFIAAELAAGRTTANLTLHYPETGGLAVQERIDLNNPATNGATPSEDGASYNCNSKSASPAWSAAASLLTALNARVPGPKPTLVWANPTCGIGRRLRSTHDG
ncbi:hypothetical protein J2W30_006898 [Variovorax boronicumulans]|uniref:hypothetical protein n=1 Tax=Variovorax boronicumulans TaxID=436515 RepID=UPI00277E2CEF|nr:hypothetical protein [Variovorax boronicumulans]MDQ0039105.1 hypothetical protein [Variovorax boronicumulans]MDQ0045712.1 hypothetical protein [Variovorax boronicumulans]